MDIDRSSVLAWAYCSPEKSMEELRECLFSASLELENTKVAAQQELRRRDEQLLHLREILDRTSRERDEAQEKYQKALLENLLLQQQMQMHMQMAPAATAAAAPPASGVSSVVEDEQQHRMRGGGEKEKEKDSSNTLGGGNGNGGFSDCEDSIVSSPQNPNPIHQPKPVATDSLDSLLPPEKPLPEKGKLLQAVMKAGPLLQTLLLAGPLPQWRHPPPPLESSEIPPVKIPSPPPPPPPVASPLFLQDSLLMMNINSITINNNSNNSTVTSCGRLCAKRRLSSEGMFDFPTETKYQRVALP